MNSGHKYALAVFLSFLATGCIAQPGGAFAGKKGVLAVGPGKPFALPSEAALAAKAGDLIQIDPGTYTDCARWDADALVIEGTAPGVIIADKTCNDKGLFIIRGRDITIRNITFTAARSSAHNGSGIRAEGFNLTVENSRFIDDEDGILAADNDGSTIVIRNSYFSGNGNCIGLCAHGIYVNHVALLRIENSEFVAQHAGHHIKSRARRTEITSNFVHDGPTGSASYLVDLPNGGSALISGNRFEKGPLSENRQTAISIGAERARAENPPGDIVIENNEFSNDTGGTTVFVKNYSDTPVALSGNRFSGAIVPLTRAEDRQAAPKQRPGR
jgi:polygalacturonase